jgi:general secretion pathway protein N
MRPANPSSRALRPPWRWAVLGATGGLLLALLAAAPARWLGSAVRWATQERVWLQAERGTVWSGSASLGLGGGPGTRDSRSLPGRIAWRWGLSWPGLGLQLTSDCCTPQPLQWQLRLSGSGVRLELQDQQSVWPMGLLAGLGAPWNTLEAQGQLQWQSSGLRLHWQEGRLHWHGRAELLVQQLTSRLSTLQPMGSYRITLQGSEPGTTTPEIMLGTVQGPLRLQGQGQWSGQRLRFGGEAWADEGFEPALSNLLNIIGRRQGARSLLSLG